MPRSTMTDIATPPLLTVHGLQAWYGDFQALYGIDFELRAGEVLATIGANGAGKVCIQPPPREASRTAGHGGAADALAGQPEGTSAGSRLGGDVLSIQAMTAPCR